jgi:predicted Zn-dependent protease
VRSPASVLRRRTPVALLAWLAACATGDGSFGLEREEELGREFAQTAGRELPLLRDRSVDEYVGAIGLRLVEAAGPQPFRYRFYVVADASPNAFAAPAGRIYVHTGTIRAVQREDELAAVLAHEIGHVVHRHLLEWEDYAWQVSAREQLRGSRRDDSERWISQMRRGAVLSQFGQAQELEADRFAVSVLPRAGYDPEAVPGALRTLTRAAGAADVAAPSSSHPDLSKRVDALRGEIESQANPRRGEARDPERLREIQRRIEALADRGPRASAGAP